MVPWQTYQSHSLPVPVPGCTGRGVGMERTNLLYRGDNLRYYRRARALSGGASCLGTEIMFAMPESGDPSISVIIPFRNASTYLDGCLRSLAASRHADYELILVDDGSTDCSRQIAERYAARLVTLKHSRGPAYARNRGAESARGTILFFLDADVLCQPDTLSQVERILDENPEADALIGSYDDDPPETNFVSRYKNLTHHFVHQTARAEASTFWTGCGAIRRTTFLRFGGFDESYRRPSIEDIELGYRLRAAGRRILLCKQLAVKHAKRWTFTGMLRSDICDRAVPWTLLQLRYGKVLNDLNLSFAQRAAALLACLAGLTLVLSVLEPRFLIGAGVCLALLAWLNRNLYRFYVRQGGMWFAARSAGMHWLYYIYSVAAFLAGYVHFHRTRSRDRRGGAVQ
jgi:glycosyltransferase involved in cell wall biosynthesis